MFDILKHFKLYLRTTFKIYSFIIDSSFIFLSHSIWQDMSKTGPPLQSSSIILCFSVTAKKNESKSPDLYVPILLQDNFSKAISTINLSGCMYVTDWGLHWLAELLKDQKGQTNVIACFIHRFYCTF